MFLPLFRQKYERAKRLALFMNILESGRLFYSPEDIDQEFYKNHQDKTIYKTITNSLLKFLISTLISIVPTGLVGILLNSSLKQRYRN